MHLGVAGALHPDEDDRFGIESFGFVYGAMTKPFPRIVLTNERSE